tara:strand:- start:46723 stop:47763 length:1041 start_codon:yes stop_codon:yes gene_type:complete
MKTAQEIADYLGGTLIGKAEHKINALGSLEHAGQGTLTYAETDYLDQVSDTRASCVLVPSGQFPNHTVILVDNPRLAFAKIAHWLFPFKPPFNGIHDTALVDAQAAVSANVAIGAWTIVESGSNIGQRTVIFPGCYIGHNCHIGEDCIVYPRVVLYAGTALGDRAIIHAGAVIGADGFGFVSNGEQQIKVPQLGTVAIGSDVEIGANTCIDRGTLDTTHIDNGTKLDNLCQIAHNVQIGRDTAISSQTGIAGSSHIGNQVIIGGQVGVGDHCHINDQAMIGSQGGIPSRKRIPSGEVYWGTPARPLKDVKLQQAHIGRLPKLAQEVKNLRAEFNDLKKSSSQSSSD